MPRNGRSARAGAERSADFFSGKGALSSLAAAAGGGVTVELGLDGRIGRSPKKRQ
jgi:hypothetical protein